MQCDEKPKVVVIAGPTASGKTALSVKLSLAIFEKGEIINADSMQVYTGMDIGTAKPTPEDQRGIVHHLLDVVEPGEEFNAAVFCSLALPLVKDIEQRGKVCFVVGGTGLYIKSLVEGLFNCPSVDLDLRKELNLECEALGLLKLHERLKRIDPETAGRIHPNDKLRIIRALEIFHLTDRRPTDLVKEQSLQDRPVNALKLCLDVDRNRLYERINQRSLAMVEAGLPAETEQLLAKGYSPDLKPMKAIGYRHMVKYLDGDCSLEEAVYGLQRDTRRYAKRQLTWFRADPEYVWIAPEDLNSAKTKIDKFLY